MCVGVALPLWRYWRPRFRKLKDIDHEERTLAESHLVGAEQEELQVLGVATDSESTLMADNAVKTVKRHRRLRKGKALAYRHVVLSELKVRFGCPERNAANLGAVRRAAYAIMGDHGLRPSHQHALIGMLVESTFIPDQYDCAAEQWRLSWAVKERLLYFKSLGVRSWWQH